MTATTIIEKIEQAVTPVLEVGESFLGGAVVHLPSLGLAENMSLPAPGTLGSQTAWKLRQESRRGHDASGAPGDAGAVPVAQGFWMAVTTGRLLFFEDDLVSKILPSTERFTHPGKLFSTIAIDELTAAPTDEGRGRFTLSFRDGSSAPLQSTQDGSAGALLGAIGRALAPA